MPARDGTGPLGQGAMTGRGMGFCRDNTGLGSRSVRYGRRCLRRYNYRNVDTAVTKEALQAQINDLQNQLDSLK